MKQRTFVNADAAPIRHLAVIMDGNGRWARMRGLPRWKGHRAGADAVRRTVEWACRKGIPVLTLFAFSSENWRRPAREVDTLFRLFRSYLEEEREALVENGIRLTAMGRRDRLAPSVGRCLADTEAATAGGRRLHLRLAIDYGARREIVEAAKSLAWKIARGELHPEQIDEIRFGGTLSAEDIPDPDLIIRTSGEYRLSNFMLWQAAYSELYFCPKLWPDLEPRDLDSALEDYGSRSRRFGALPGAAKGAVLPGPALSQSAR